MGSSALANIFMCSFENKWLKDCPYSMFMIYLYYFKERKIMLKKENDGCLSFLGINIFVKNGKFVTAYQEKTISGIHINIISIILETYKTGSIKSHLFRCSNLCSDFVKFHHEIY